MNRHFFALLFAAGLVAAMTVLPALPAPAATIAVTPSNYLAALAAVQPGDVLAAAPGQYPSARVANQTFSPPVTLSAPATAIFGQLSLVNVDGFTTIGGSFSGSPLYGIAISGGAHITLTKPLFSNERTGVAAGGVDTLVITGAECLNLHQDCFDIGSSQHVKILYSLAHGGTPYDGAHPDFVQMRSAPGTAPLVDVEIAFNYVIGATQGIDMFGNKVPAVGINVHDNRAMIAFPAFVDLRGACSGCSIVNNHGDASRAADHVVNVGPAVPYPGWTGTISGNTVSLRPTALPQ